MLKSQQGSIYRVVLGFFIVLAFCFALAWPQYSKRRDAKQLANAADLGRALAFAEQSYKQAKGQYTDQLSKLDLSLPCPVIVQDEQILLSCKEYTYQLVDNSYIKAAHKHLPVWLEVDLTSGTTVCKHEKDDWAGQDLCAHMQ